MNLSLIRSMTRSAVFELENGLCYRPAHPFTVTLNGKTVFDACKAKAEELGKKNGWLLYPLGIALSGKQRTPGGGTDLVCMMGREKTLQRVQDAIAKLNG